MAACLLFATAAAFAEGNFTITGTAQSGCYSDVGERMSCLSRGNPLRCQDAQQQRNRLAYRDSADGTVTDTVTGLT